jgi:RNA polymerase sigma-70 factor (ECF subfamily)
MAEPIPVELAQAREQFAQLVEGLRPELHRYCARMTGSAIEGEDVVQDVLAKAYYTLPMMTEMPNMRAWLFRIAHNRAVDLLRGYERRNVEQLEDPVLEQAEHPLESRELAQFALSLYLRLTPVQRSCVILKDVLDHSLAEISELLNISVPAIKAALHRGRAALRELAASQEAPAEPRQQGRGPARIDEYVARFNSRDWDGLRAMLADDVQLDLIGRARRSGAAEVGGYFHRYSGVDDWRLERGTVEGRDAVLVHDPQRPEDGPVYFILLEWEGERLARIRDYRYARYVAREAGLAIEQRLV